MNSVRLNLFKKNSTNKYEWCVLPDFFTQECTKGLSVVDIESIDVENLIIKYTLLKYTHMIDGPAATLIQDGIKVYESFWEDGLPSERKL